MEHVLDLIANGRAGHVAAMGMGGVFMALLFLFLFISSLGKVYRFSKLRGRKKSAPPSEPPEKPAGKQRSGEEIALQREPPHRCFHKARPFGGRALLLEGGRQAFDDAAVRPAEKGLSRGAPPSVC